MTESAKHPKVHIMGARDSIAIEPGRWYFGFECRHCQRQMALFEDEHAGQVPYHQQAGQWPVRCRYCGETGTYAAGDIKSFQGTARR